MNTDLTPLVGHIPKDDAPVFRYDENLAGIDRFDWGVRTPKHGERNLSGYTPIEKAYILDKATRSCYVWRDGQWRNDFARSWSWNDEAVSVDEFARRLKESPLGMPWCWMGDGFWSIKDFNA